jgi:hypothetical protein
MDGSDDHSLQRALTALHTELGRSTRLDDASRAALRGALGEIEARLRHPDGTAAAAAAPHGLDAMAVGFEADHPALAASLRRFIELLGQAGL